MQKRYLLETDLNKSKVLQITSGEAQRAETSALVRQASLFQLELTLPAEPLCLWHEVKWFGFSRIPAILSQCSGVTLTPWFYAQERLGHNQIQAPAPMESWRSSQCGGTQREDSDPSEGTASAVEAVLGRLEPAELP